LKPFWWCVGNNISALEPEGSVDAVRRFVNHETGSAKDTKAKEVTGDQTHVEKAVHKGNVNGHTADRTNMLPWESCGPGCPMCAEFEK